MLDSTDNPKPPSALPAGDLTPAHRGRRRSFLPPDEDRPPPAPGRPLSAEQRLGQVLTDPDFPYHFVRRHFLQGVRVDFYCPPARLAVHLDLPRRPRKSQLTEVSAQELEKLGIQVLRIPEARVTSHLREVVAVIRKACEERVGRRANPEPEPPPPAENHGRAASPPTVRRVASREKVVFAREQRREPTEMEECLWGYLRAATTVHKFRRQHPVQDFVLDFYCPEAKLAVEIDGPTHVRQADYDAWRDERLRSLGIQVLRIREEEVRRDPARAVAMIREACRKRLAEGQA